MVIENDPSARMQMRSRGQLVAPACCCVCGGSDTERGYLDLGAFIEYHGTLYLCHLCLTQGAEIAGMFTPAEVKHLQTQISTLLNEKETILAELTEANAYINNFDALLRTAFNPASVTSDNPSKDIAEATERSENREPEVTEPTTFFDSEPTSGPKLRNITFG